MPWYCHGRGTAVQLLFYCHSIVMLRITRNAGKFVSTLSLRSHVTPPFLGWKLHLAGLVKCSVLLKTQALALRTCDQGLNKLKKNAARTQANGPIVRHNPGTQAVSANRPAPGGTSNFVESPPVTRTMIDRIIQPAIWNKLRPEVVSINYLLSDTNLVLSDYCWDVIPEGNFALALMSWRCSWYCSVSREAWLKWFQIVKAVCSNEKWIELAWECVQYLALVSNDQRYLCSVCLKFKRWLAVVWHALN